MHKTLRDTLFFHMPSCKPLWLILKMHSLITIVGMVLTGKENYKEWYRKIKSTLIFNDLWNGICEATTITEEEVESCFESVVSEAKSKSSRPPIPTSNKEHAIWKDKDQKAYVVISVTVSEEVSHHIASINDSYSTLKRLNDLYDTHSELGTHTTNGEALQPRVEE
jgi:hypothetical protein